MSPNGPFSDHFCSRSYIPFSSLWGYVERSNTLTERGKVPYSKLDFAEKQRIQRSNQIFLRLRKELHDRDAQFAEKDVREAAQSARWLREITEQYAGDWEQTYEDALAESELTEEDEAYLQSGVKEAGGFSPFVQRNLRRRRGLLLIREDRDIAARSLTKS